MTGKKCSGKASFGFLAKDGPVSIDESAFDMIVTYDRSAVMPNTGLDITLLSEGQGYKEFHIPYAELAYGNGFIRRENLSQSTTSPFFDPGNIIGGIAHVAYDSGISGTAKVIPNVRIELKPR